MVPPPVFGMTIERLRILHLLDRERNPLFRNVHTEDDDLDHVPDGQHLGGMLDEAVDDFGDMHESVLMHADVDEHAEINHVSHRSRQNHAGHDILDVQHVRAQHGLWQLVARVAPGLDELFDHVLERRQAHAALRRELALAELFHALRQVGNVPGGDVLELVAGEVQQLFRRRVALRMHARVVKHEFALRHAQKARALFERLRPHLRHLHELLAATKRAVFLAIDHDVLRERLV
ncbi:hypothetical protein SDC9_162299 [bioreactor metagenome]|uniref:Uncharacterized protein n=1 Tax=bioreactor metagenome TaxID=1076179 RepID=A0A645FM03_9ZZZZ